jgi:ATP/maltotriose-dependent transcriptional regulator MalT
MNLRILIILIALAALAGCGDMMKGKAEAAKAIPEFHALYDQKKYSVIYAAADKTFTAATTQAKMNEYLGAVHRKLGKVKGSSNKNWKVNNWNGKTYVIMLQETEFERGTGMETFTYVMEAGKPILQRYDINSADLITK